MSISPLATIKNKIAVRLQKISNLLLPGNKFKKLPSVPRYELLS